MLSAKNTIYVKILYLESFYMKLQNRKYLASIIYNSVITCDEVIDAEAKSNNDETKTISTNFNEF